MPHISVARRFLDACEAAYGGNISQDNDLGTQDNTVSAYKKHLNQKKYSHMYFAKSAACWRAIHRRLDLDGDLVSVGAGPAFCAFGWFWDQIDLDEEVVCYDVLNWGGVRNMPEWKALAKSCLPARFRYHSYRYIPEGSLPSQVQNAALKNHIPTSVEPAEIGEGKTVIFPFLLNHIFGRYGASNDRTARAFGEWILSVAEGNTVVLADMPLQSDTRYLWETAGELLGSSDPIEVNFGPDADDIATAYSSGWQRRRRAGLSESYRRAGVIVRERGKWRSL